MGFIRKIEESAAKKLKKVFLDAQKYADQTIEELEAAEQALHNAKIKAAEATEQAHHAARDAAQKAQAAAAELLIESKIAEERMMHHKEILENSNK